MADIRIKIRIAGPTEKSEAVETVPNDVPASRVAEILVERLGLPSRDREGRRLLYWLSVPGPDDDLVGIRNDLSLQENRIQEGDVLQLDSDATPQVVSQVWSKLTSLQYKTQEEESVVLDAAIPTDSKTLKALERFKSETGYAQAETSKARVETLRPGGGRDETGILDSLLDSLRESLQAFEQDTEEGVTAVDRIADGFARIGTMAQGLDQIAEHLKGRITDLEGTISIQNDVLQRYDAQIQDLYQELQGTAKLIPEMGQLLRKYTHLCQDYQDHINKLNERWTIESPEPESPEAIPGEGLLPRIAYFDFDLNFSVAPPEYRAEASWVDQGRRMDGEHHFQMPVSLTELEYDYLRDMGLASRAASQANKLARELGQKLFNAVFAGTIRDCFRDCRSRADSEDCGVRIRLDFRDAPQLINYPWELLWNEDDEFLARSIYTPVVRYLSSARAPRASKVALPLRMLVVTASPAGYQPLNSEQEKENLHQALAGLVGANLLEIQYLDHATPARLRQALRQNLDLHILHYIGHGDVSETRGGYLVLEREGGQTDLMDGQRLSALLRDCRQMRLVTLNTCRGARATGDDPFASIAMALTRAHMPAVVAMQHEIHDQTAVRFSKEFYGRLTAGWSVYTALSEARIALYVDHASDIEWIIPVLYSRSPDGIIFKRPEPAAQ